MNTQTPPEFIFTPENIKAIQAHITKYPEGRQQSAILPALDLAQRQNGGWLSQAALQAVAHVLEIPILHVVEVASFYSMFHLKPVGKFHIQVCGTTPCWLRGAADIKATCLKKLDLTSEGEITSDGKFSVQEVECLGACVNGPIVQINDDYYEDLSAEHMEKILETLMTQTAPPPSGSQIGRQGSAPLGYHLSNRTHTDTRADQQKEKASQTPLAPSSETASHTHPSQE